MIKPTNGRIVWFTPGPRDAIGRYDTAQPLAAIVTHVVNDRMVNLCVFDSAGNAAARTSVPLLQDGDDRPEGCFAEWMPYQKGQAAKAEALEKAGEHLRQVEAPGLTIAPPSRDDMVERIAEVCHEVNRAYCLSQGDDSQPDWAAAPDWQKDSARKGVAYALGNPAATPADSHNSWLKEKEADGWRYGEVKDPEKKTHPCFLPYDQLPAVQKAKDYIFLAIVRSLAPVDIPANEPAAV
jgi:hypothetical protein